MTPTTLIVLAIVAREGRYLIVEERDGTFYLPAGKVEPGENLIAAAVRETAEEAGVLIGLIGLPLDRATRARASLPALPRVRVDLTIAGSGARGHARRMRTGPLAVDGSTTSPCWVITTSPRVTSRRAA